MKPRSSHLQTPILEKSKKHVTYVFQTFLTKYSIQQSSDCIVISHCLRSPKARHFGYLIGDLGEGRVKVPESSPRSLFKERASI